MASVNKVILIGNLTRDPEHKTLEGSDQVVCKFGLATNRSWKNKAGEKQEAVEFHNIVVWGKLAEVCAQYLHKGKQVYICGRLETRSWEDEGIKKYMTQIIADEMTMLGSKGDSEGGQRQERPRTSSASSSRSEASSGGGDDIRLEDIPF